jgi:hypothetical protein
MNETEARSQIEHSEGKNSGPSGSGLRSHRSPRRFRPKLIDLFKALVRFMRWLSEREMLPAEPERPEIGRQPQPRIRLWSPDQLPEEASQKTSSTDQPGEGFLTWLLRPEGLPKLEHREQKSSRDRGFLVWLVHQDPMPELEAGIHIRTTKNKGIVRWVLESEVLPTVSKGRRENGGGNDV